MMKSDRLMTTKRTGLLCALKDFPVDGGGGGGRATLVQSSPPPLSPPPHCPDLVESFETRTEDFYEFLVDPTLRLQSEPLPH